MVKTKHREVFDVGINVSHDDGDADDDDVGTYLENVPYNITTNNACDDANDSHTYRLELMKNEPFRIHC